MATAGGWNGVFDLEHLFCQIYICLFLLLVLFCKIATIMISKSDDVLGEQPLQCFWQSGLSSDIRQSPQNSSSLASSDL